MRNLFKSFKSFQSLQFLDLSFNNLTSIDLNYSKKLSFLDLSHNVNIYHLNVSESLQILNLSNTSARLILDLNFLTDSNLEEIDLSLNNLKYLSLSHFEFWGKIKKLNLRDTNFTDFKALKALPSELLGIDLSYNLKLEDESLVLSQYKKIEIIKVSNRNLSSIYFEFGVDFQYLKYLDLSFNRLKSITDIPLSLFYLNISYNSLEFIVLSRSQFKNFMNYFSNLKSIDLSKSLSKTLSGAEFFFKKILEKSLFAIMFISTLKPKQKCLTILKSVLC